jgi:Arc/MetJ family transcription regulator
MRTTLDIDRRLLEEAMRVSGAATKTAAVQRGLEALVAEAARRRLAALRGKIPEATAPPRRRPAEPGG